MYQADYKKRREMRKFLHSKLSIFLMFGVVLIMLISIVKIVPKLIETNENKENALSELNKIRNQEAGLLLQIDSLSSEAGKERALREKFRVTKDGEGLIVIIDDRDKTDLTENTDSKSKIRSFYNKIFNN